MFPQFFFILVAGSIIGYYFSRPSALVVINTVPANQGSQNPYTPVAIVFNRAPKNNEVPITINPSTAATFIYGPNNEIQIVPKNTFAALTPYTITVGTNPPYALIFTTEQTISNTPGWNDSFANQYQVYEKQNGAQDAALTNIRTHAPYSGNGYSLTYSYADNTYTITLSSPYDESKNNFLTWFKDQGVADLSTVRINYLNQP